MKITKFLAFYIVNVVLVLTFSVISQSLIDDTDFITTFQDIFKNSAAAIVFLGIVFAMSAGAIFSMYLVTKFFVK